MTHPPKKIQAATAHDARLKRLRAGGVDPEAVPNAQAAEANPTAEQSDAAVQQPQLEASELSGLEGTGEGTVFSSELAGGQSTDFSFDADGLEAADGQLGVFNMHDMAGNEAGMDVIPASAEMLAAGAVLSPGTFGAAGAGLIGSTGLAAGGATGLSATTLGAVGAGVAAAAAGVAVAVGGGSSKDAFGSSGGLGSVTDGRIAGAHLYVDENDNGKYDAGDTDTGVVTSATGTFSLSTTYAHALLAVGGTNVDTGLANTLTFSAAAGSTTLNPITTLIETYVRNQHVTATEAEAVVKAALGLSAVTQSLLTYDPLAVAASNPTDATALAVQKAAVALATAAANAQSAGAAGTTYGVDFFKAVSDTISGGTISASAPLDLSSSTTLDTLDTAMGGKIAGVKADIAQDVGVVMAATSLSQTGAGSLTLAQKGALDGTVETYTSLAAAQTALAGDATALDAGAFNLKMSATDLQAAFGSNPEIVANALNIQVTDACSVSIATIIEGYAHVGATSLTISDTLAHLVVGGTVASAVKGAVNVVVSDSVDMAVAATLANLALVEAATTGDISVSAISGTAAQLLPGGVALRYIGAGTEVTVADAATLLQLKNLDAANGTGAVHYTAITDTAAHLAANADGFVTGSVNVTVTDAATAAQLVAIDGLTGGTLAYTAITDSAANIISADGGSHILTTTAVTLVGASEIAQLEQIAAKTPLTLTYGTVSGSQALLLGACTTNLALVSGHALLVNDSASIAQLTAIRTYTTGTVSGTLITDTADNITADIATANTFVTGAVNVTISEPVGGAPGTLTGATIEQLRAIDAHTTGTLVYVNVKDTIAHLLADHSAGNYASAHATFVSDSATIEQLTTLETNGATVTATLITDTAAHLAADAGHFSHSVLTPVESVVTDAATIEQLTVIFTHSGAGHFTYTAMADTAAHLAGNVGGFVTGAVNVTVTDAATLDQLAAIDLLTTAPLVYTEITGDAATLAANAGGFITGAVETTITGTASVTQLAAIDLLTTGALHYTAITGTAAELAASSYVIGAVNVTITSVPTIEQLTAIDAHTTGTLGYTSVQDTVDNLLADHSPGNYVSGHATVVSGSATIEQLTTLEAKGATVTATLITDTAARLAADANHFITGSVNVTLTDAATAAQLVAIDGWTNGTLTYTAITDTAANIISADGGSHILATTDVTLVGNSDVSTLSQIAAKTPHSLTYTTVTGALAALDTDITGASSVASGHPVLITGQVTLATGSVADADAVAKLTSISGGATSVMFADKVWATVDQALNLPALTHGVMPTLEITNAVSLADLATIDGHVTGIINAVCITGTADELLALGDSPYFHSGMGFQVSGEYTAVQLAQLQSIAGAGVVTTTVPTPIDPTADARAPHLVSASVDPADGHKLILVFDDAINSTPSDTAYTIGKDGEATAVKTDGSGVSVSGSTVTLTLTDEIHFGQSVTLSYHGDTIADSSGNHAADITGYNVWNNMPDTTAPQFVQAVLTKAGTIILGYDEGLAASASISGYSVHVSHAGGGFDDYTCTGAVANTGDHIVTLTGAGAIATTDIVTVTYTGTGVTDTATTPNVSTGLTSAAVVNSSTLSHIADMSADAPGNGLLHLDFGIALDTSAAVLASDFDVTVAHADGSHGVAALAMSTVSSSGHSVTLQLDHDLLQGDIVTVDYHGSSIHAVDGTLAAHFTNVDVVGASEEALQMATASSFATLAASQEHLSHSDSLWVDFTDGALTNGQHDLGILNDLGAHQTLALGDSVDIDPSVHANGTDAYHVDMGHSTFTTLSLFGTGDHTVVLNNAVDTVVISDTQNGGSKLDLTNVLDTHHLTIDFSHSVSLTGTSIAADDVNATGEFNVTHDTTANTADIKYYNDTLHATAVLHLIGVDDTATIGTADTSNITIG